MVDSSHTSRWLVVDVVSVICICASDFVLIVFVRGVFVRLSEFRGNFGLTGESVRTVFWGSMKAVLDSTRHFRYFRLLQVH